MWKSGLSPCFLAICVKTAVLRQDSQAIGGFIVRIVKRRTIIISAAILAVLIIVSAITATAIAINSSSVPKIGYTVVIDAGHGGRDNGVSGANGSKEAALNLDVAKKLERYLVRSGITVVMTRTNGNGLYGLATKNFKTKDMLARETIIKEASPDLVLSIHMNAFPQSNQRGAQVFYRGSNSESVRLAGIIQSMLAKNIEHCDRKQMAGDYYILNSTNDPAVLIECGFLSNPGDEQLLMSDGYQEKIAYNIYLGAMKYLDCWDLVSSSDKVEMP